MESFPLRVSYRPRGTLLRRTMRRWKEKWRWFPFLLHPPFPIPHSEKKTKTKTTKNGWTAVSIRHRQIEYEYLVERRREDVGLESYLSSPWWWYSHGLVSISNVLKMPLSHLPTRCAIHEHRNRWAIRRLWWWHHWGKTMEEEKEEDEIDDTNPERFPPPLVLPVRKKESKVQELLDLGGMEWDQ